MSNAWRESTTFKLVFTSWLAVFAKFVLADVNLPYNLGTVSSMSAGEFAAATAAILTVWLGREWRAAHYSQKQ